MKTARTGGAASDSPPADSVANVSNIVTVDKRILLEYCGRLRPRTMEAIGLGMRLVLEL